MSLHFDSTEHPGKNSFYFSKRFPTRENAGIVCPLAAKCGTTTGYTRVVVVLSSCQELAHVCVCMCVCVCVSG